MIDASFNSKRSFRFELLRGIAYSSRAGGQELQGSGERERSGFGIEVELVFMPQRGDAAAREEVTIDRYPSGGQGLG